MSEAKLMITGALGNGTMASVAVFSDDSWRVDLQAPGAEFTLTEAMVAELQGLLRRAGVNRKKKESKDV